MRDTLPILFINRKLYSLAFTELAAPLPVMYEALGVLKVGPHRRTPKPRPEPGSPDVTPPIYIVNVGGQSPYFPVEPVAESLVSEP
jgi:hypothetical protein